MIRSLSIVVCLLVIVFVVSCYGFKNPKTHNYDKPAVYKDKYIDSARGYLNPMRTCFDVKFYSLDISVYPKSKSISGTVEIYFEMLNMADRIQIDLVENLKIDKITNSSNQNLTFKRNDRAVVVQFEKPLPSGTSTFISVTYSGKPQIAKKPPWKGGLVWERRDGKPFIGVACEDDGASIWWPLKDHISDKPDSVRAAFTIPKGLFCVGNGRLINREEVGEDQEKFTWQTSYPVNTYNVSFYIGDYQHFQLAYEGPFGDHKLDFYVLPENQSKAISHFKQCRKVMSVFETLFGEYPWWKDGYKLVESPYQGMEHQTAIAYGDEFKDNKWLGFDYIIVHETAHEWWGNKVTVCDMADLWIHEGFATYAEALYVEAAGLDYGYDGMMWLNRFTSRNEFPVVGPKDVCYVNSDDGDIYPKGAMTLHTLRYLIDNDSVFFKIIYRFATEYSDECVTTQDFIDLVNLETKSDLTWLFDQFLYRREPPELLYTIEYDSYRQYKFYYRWNSKMTNDNFQLPLYLIVNGNRIKYTPSHELQSFTFKVGATYNVMLEGTLLIVLTDFPDING